MCGSLNEARLSTGRAANDQSYASRRPCGSAEDRPSRTTELPMSTLTAVPAFAIGATILSAQAVANASARQPPTRPSRFVMVVSPSERRAETEGGAVRHPVGVRERENVVAVVERYAEAAQRQDQARVRIDVAAQGAQRGARVGRGGVVGIAEAGLCLEAPGEGARRARCGVR